MPTLDWIGKQAVVNHHREVPTRLLHCDSDLSFGDRDAGNLLVEGDNLEALKALLPYYAGQVKCIYIDPPYNTGNEGWIYNDNVNSPEINLWIGKVTGRESEDLTRHDKWLCMMYPRLRLLRDFLRSDGVLMISIDDNELQHLREMADEIFGAPNRIATLVWKRRSNPDSRNKNGVSEDHEYIVCYGRSLDARLVGQKRDTSKYTNLDGDVRGSWMSDNLTGLAGPRERPNLHYNVIHPTLNIVFTPHPTRGWAVSPETMARLIQEERILWPKKPTGRPRIKRFQADVLAEHTGLSTLLSAPTNEAGTRELNEMFGEKVFPFPKPSALIKLLINQTSAPGDLILDSFGGSGTTGVAVAQEGDGRRFILIEMDPRIARSVTAERIQRTMEGFERTKVGGVKEVVDGTGGGFRYCTLGKPLFDAWGAISEGVTFGDLAAYVFFSETGSPIPHRADGSTSYIGKFKDRAVYLLFDRNTVGVADSRSGNVLTLAVLDALPSSADYRVIYAEGCTVPAERLASANVVFKQVPYQLAAG